MKLKPRTFQIYWDAHAWLGVVAALLLYVMFFMGAFALFYQELNTWANPVAAPASGAASPALQPLLEALDREQPLIGKDRVAFIPEATGLRAYWHAGDEHHEFRYCAATGRLEPLRSQLGSFLYSLHYLGPIPNGIYLAGVAALALLLVLVTGLFLQLKDLVRQWFQFRPERVPRTWSSDLHKVLGVFGLPYQLLYAWTGVVLCLSYQTLEPAFLATLFQGNRAAVSAVRGDAGDPPEPTHRSSGKLPHLDALVVRAVAEVPELKPNWVGIEYVGDERSSVSVYGDVSGLPFGTAGVMFNSSDGALLGVTKAGASTLQRFEAWFYGLHYARFGGYGIKLVYALLALATCAVIVTGNLVWLERRDARRAQRGNRVLERLTAGGCAGLMLATSSMFLANRLLAAWGAASAVAEQTVFWGVWGLGTLAAFVGRSSRRLSGVELVLSGALLGVALGLDLATTALGLEDPLRRGVNAGLLLLGLSCCVGGGRLLRPRAASERGKPSAAAAAPLLAEAE
jgi:uncharacterized iron-regulated membrane protein